MLPDRVRETHSQSDEAHPRPRNAEASDGNDSPAPFVSLDRRRLLATLGSFSAVGLAGCSGAGDSEPEPDDADADENDDSNGGTDADENDDSNGGAGGSCSFVEADLEPYDVSGTFWVVEPSFPSGWDQHRGQDQEEPLELGFAYQSDPDINTNTHAVVVTHLDSPSEKNGVPQQSIDSDNATEDEPVTIGGEELTVAFVEEGMWQLTPPSPAGEYYNVSVIVDQDDCDEEMIEMGRRVVDALVQNDDTTA